MHDPHSPASAQVRRAVGAAVTALSVAGIAAGVGCSDTLRPLGPTPAAAEARADELFSAFAARFDDPLLSPRYDHARLALAGSALVPSRIFDDTTIWTVRPSATTRLFYVNGTLTDGRYHLEERAAPTPAVRVGDTRHTIALERLAPSVYRWNTNVELAVGDASAADVSTFISALLASPERGESVLRDDYRSAFPRAAAAFGRGFTIDSLRAEPSAGGSTAVTLTVAFDPARMRPAFPAFANYLDKYLGPARYHLVLSDRDAALLDAVGANRRVTVRYRIQHGALVSLFGPPRPWPDSLTLAADLALKVKHLTVGFHDLRTDFVIANSGHDRSWTIVAQHEPSWDLPLMTERLLRTPLRRPFEGPGATFRLSVRDSAGGETMFGRRTRLDVEESAIMRFIGALASHAIGDLDYRVEAEEDRFLHEGFAAAAADVHALGGRWSPATPEP